MTFSLLATGGLVLVALFLLQRKTGGLSMAANTLKEQIASGAMILDVRSPEEFRGGAYPGAINIPVQELRNRLGEISKDNGIIVYCASGGRSSTAAAILKQAGFLNVTNAGGVRQMPF